MSKFAAMGVPVDKFARMTILHPYTNEPMVDQEGKPAFIDVYSGDSDRARSYNRKTSQRKLDMRGRAVVSAASIESEGYGLLAELSVAWHLVDLNGDAIDVPFTTQAARELYAEPSMTWLKEQVDAFAAARGNFSKPSANPSTLSQSENSQGSEK